MSAIQINCPRCHGANPPSEHGSYECVFCLEPFTVQQAQTEESRVQADLDAWMKKVVGTASQAGSIDASSRTYIFRDKVLPGLHRDVNRSVEGLGTFGQFPLLAPPVRLDQRQGNPLVAQRREILALKLLQARLASPDIVAFAVEDEDKAQVQAMERRITDFIKLSNVAEAASNRTSRGYRSSKENLVHVIEELDESLAGTSDPNQADYLGQLKARYRALADLAGLCETACSPDPVDGETLAQQVDRVVEALDGAAKDIEAMDFNPADTMPVVIGTNAERDSAVLFARWLRSYASLGRRGNLSFPDCVHELEQLFSSRAKNAQDLCELVEGCVEAFKAIRGELLTPSVTDNSWVETWVEKNRKKKSLWLFGTEESTDTVEQFLLPVWVAEVRFSQNKGGVFAEGIENMGLALVDACSPSSDGVLFIKSMNDSLASSLEHGEAFPGGDMALPASTPAAAAAVMERSMKSKAGIGNSRVTMRGLAWLPAAIVHYSSTDGDRSVASCLNGKLKTTTDSRIQMLAARQALDVFN
jgi:hypothetical protein